MCINIRRCFRSRSLHIYETCLAIAKILEFRPLFRICFSSNDILLYSALWPFRYQQVLANPLTENFISNIYVDTLHDLNFIDVLDTEIRESVATLVCIYKRIMRVIVPRFEILLPPLRNANIMLAMLMFARDLKAYVDTIKDI